MAERDLPCWCSHHRDERLDVERVVASATAQAEVHVDVAGEEGGAGQPRT